MVDHEHRSKNNERARDKLMVISDITMSSSYGSRESLLSDICTDFLPVVYQSGIGSSLMAFEHSKDDKEFHHLNYEDHPILKSIQDNIIGHDLIINTPYGHRPVVYCDFTASGRSLAFVEDFIRDNVIPSYANTHSTTGHNAIQTGNYREEARSIIKDCVNASKDDVVIFTGSGATSALHKFAWALKVNQKHVAKETVVLIGPYEHHSNILPWREFGTKVVRLHDVPETGLIDLHHLESTLMRWRDKCRQILVCISAASNVSGLITDTDVISTIAHKYGAFVLFDYAAAGPYLKLDMNPGKTAYKDAAIVSPHKFAGGPGTPGLLIAKKWIFRNSIPDRVGGGTVNYVTREIHSYVSHLEEREEGGTPAITESIRAGLVFKLKQDVGEDIIEGRDEELCSRAFTLWEKNPSIYILGNHTSRRLPIFSFLTKHMESGKLIHHNYISTLLSDLFGIQARGGCACAGPYAADLLGMPEPLTQQYAWFLSETTEKNDNQVPKISLQIMKPGFTRINLVYFNEDEIIDFVIAAVDMVTKHGWKLLPQYTFDLENGSWKHREFSNTKASQLKTLKDASIISPQKTKSVDSQNMENVPTLNEVLSTAKKIFDHAEIQARLMTGSPESIELYQTIPRDMQKLVWFLTPLEATSFLLDKNKALSQQKYVLPFNLVQPVNRIIPDYDSDYHSAVSLLGNSSTESHYSDTKSDSKSKDHEENKQQYVHRPQPDDQTKSENLHRVGHNVLRKVIDPRSRPAYHHAGQGHVVSQSYSSSNRPMHAMPIGYPLKGGRELYMGHKNVTGRTFERIVLKDTQERDNIYKQKRNIPVKSHPANTYYVKLVPNGIHVQPQYGMT